MKPNFIEQSEESNKFPQNSFIILILKVSEFGWISLIVWSQTAPIIFWLVKLAHQGSCESFPSKALIVCPQDF
jgi:hypothetical protein